MNQQPYKTNDSGLLWTRTNQQQGQYDTLLANFQARITAQIVRDDGAERQQLIELETILDRETFKFTIPASHFERMNWPIEQMGPRAVIFAGQSRERTREAIQLLSNNIVSRTVYAHTGWRQISDKWVFLHAGGAIGPNGPEQLIEVDLPDALRLYDLPTPPAADELRDCIRDSLAIADCRSAVIPWCALWRSVLGGEPDFTTWLVGASGAFKSELSAVLLQHFGTGLDRLHLPASWASTDNSLEVLAHAAKDVLLVIDDFAPRGSAHDVHQLHAKADRVLRAQGNRSCRQRARQDGTIRPGKPPRGLILSSGEDLPMGASVLGRLAICELTKGEITSSVLSVWQKSAAAGTFAKAMSGFILWLACRKCQECQFTGRYKGQLIQLRGRIGQAGHARTADITANLALGMQYFLEFARDRGALTEAEMNDAWQRGWTALTESAASQKEHHRGSNPATRFIDLVKSSLATASAHLEDIEGGEPAQPEAWGWRQKTIGAGINERVEWQAHGDCIGWVGRKGEILLEPDVAMKAVNNLASASGERIALTKQILQKRLKEAKLIITDTTRKTNTVRRVIKGQSNDVLLLSETALSIYNTDKSDISDNQSRFPQKSERIAMSGSQN